MKPPDDEPWLGHVLGDWRVAPARDPQFRANVWSRIEGEATAQSWPEFVRRHAFWVAGTLALAAAVGALAGSGRARSKTEADRMALATGYVHALDPRWMLSR
jgi:hypothetical protein